MSKEDEETDETSLQEARDEATGEVEQANEAPAWMRTPLGLAGACVVYYETSSKARANVQKCSFA